MCVCVCVCVCVCPLSTKFRMLTYSLSTSGSVMAKVRDSQVFLVKTMTVMN